MRTILIPTLTIALAAAAAGGAVAQQVALRPATAQPCAAAPQTTVKAMRDSKSPTAAGSYPVLMTVPKSHYAGPACAPSATKPARVRATSAAPAATATSGPSHTLPIPSVH